MAQVKAEKRCPPGSLAWQQYQVQLTSGHMATIGLSLSDPGDKAMAEVKRSREADHLGFLIVLDDPDSLEEVVLWYQQETALTVASQNGDTMIGDEVKRLLPRYFAVFFDEVKDLAPDLANVRLVVPRTGDRTLN